MNSIKFTHKGDFSKTEKFLNALRGKRYLNRLDELAQLGVQALSSATPVDTGTTAASWYYEIKHDKDTTTIEWLNSNVQDNVNIAVILQYGHGTGTGGYVQGRDYINPAMRPIFDEIADKAWKEVTSL